MRFFRRGVSKMSFSPAQAGAAPTRVEIDGATPLSKDVAEIAGFQLSNSPIATPDLEDTFTGQIDGEDTVAESSVTFYDHKESVDQTVRPVLAKGTSGYLYLFPYGDVATQRMEVWEVKSTGVNDEWSVGNEAARFQIGFAVLTRPDQDVAIPA